MANTRDKLKRSLQGSHRAVTRHGLQGKPKIGVDEFMSVAERFGLSRKTLNRIKAAVEEEDWAGGPFLGNFYSGLKETKVEAFERTARELFGVNYALGLSSGTGALHSAFVAVGVGPGCEVVCPAIGFMATAAAVVATKGVPIFCDVDESLSMDPAKVERLITPRTVALAPTHVGGNVCNMAALMKIARKHKLRVVEDCAQSCGAKFNGKAVGTIGDVGCFSIAAYKIVGGGEGGLLLTNNKRLWERANQVAEGGGLWRPERFAPPRYEGELFCGTNYRMSELEAAVDVVQLRRMPATVKRLNAVKERIVKQLKTFKGIIPQKSNDVAGDVGYTLGFFPADFELGGKIVKELEAEGVNCAMRGRNGMPDWHIYSYSWPILLQCGPTGPECVYTCPHYTSRGGHVEYARGDCPVADELYDRVITISLNQWFTSADCRNVAKAINKALAAHCSEDPNAAIWM